ncbi:Gfo/Idh/MocA family protein [Tenggerimyces flavus]|uniref:Gfo/Idh/MocA family protein n=1 Tax=Tenggerimyces flavus TaxID=1708749 RepID=A0ABV7YEE7_9ACTN|nr:Gfo/Idh/MocA family oxidoreductase [Tenggerimyces flavus]MBM7791328.1 putative dehydrogenase [Tenggerimyces flavus]
MSDLQIGVIGYGLRGTLSRHAHKPGGGSRVVALYDPEPTSGERFREAYGESAAVHTDLAAFLKSELDAVFVISPDWLHEEHAVAVLEAGLPVYLEKPMAITTEGCDRLLRTAQTTGGKLYLGHNMRHMPFVREMKRLIDSGAIGEPKVAWGRHFVGHGGDFYFQDWHVEQKYGTSLLLQKGAHDLDVLHWLCSAYTTEVTAMGALTLYDQTQDKGDADPWWHGSDEERLTRWPPLSLTGLNPKMDMEDVSMMLMRLSNGVLASYQQCHYTPDYWRNYTVIGTEGRIENFGNGEPGTTIRIWNKRHHGWQEAGDQTYEVRPGEGGHGGADPEIVGEFLRYVREGGATDTSPVAARYSVATGVAGAESLRAGSTPVRVPAADPEVAAYFA